MKQKTWKIIAIIFISLFVLETLFFFYVWNVGRNVMNNEDICASEICDLDNENTKYDAYAFNYNICQCYSNHQVIYTEEIR